MAKKVIAVVKLEIEAGFVRPEDDPQVAKAKREKAKARAEAGAGAFRRGVGVCPA